MSKINRGLTPGLGTNPDLAETRAATLAVWTGFRDGALAFAIGVAPFVNTNLALPAACALLSLGGLVSLRALAAPPGDMSETDMWLRFAEACSAILCGLLLLVLPLVGLSTLGATLAFCLIARAALFAVEARDVEYPRSHVVACVSNIAMAVLALTLQHFISVYLVCAMLSVSIFQGGVLEFASGVASLRARHMRPVADWKGLASAAPTPDPVDGYEHRPA